MWNDVNLVNFKNLAAAGAFSDVTVLDTVWWNSAFGFDLLIWHCFCSKFQMFAVEIPKKDWIWVVKSNRYMNFLGCVFNMRFSLLTKTNLLPPFFTNNIQINVDCNISSYPRFHIIVDVGSCPWLFCMPCQTPSQSWPGVFRIASRMKHGLHRVVLPTAGFIDLGMTQRHWILCELHCTMRSLDLLEFV